MVSGRPIFPGSTNEEQIVLIWQILGTPTESLWEGVSQLPEYKPEDWPECDKQDLAHQMPRLNRVGLELVDRMLQYNPKMRFTAQEAMAHPYFASLSIPKTLGPSKLRLATLHYLSSSLLLFFSFFFFLCGKHSRFIHISNIALSLVPCRTKLAERWGAAHYNWRSLTHWHLSPFRCLMYVCTQPTTCFKSKIPFQPASYSHQRGSSHGKARQRLVKTAGICAVLNVASKCVSVHRACFWVHCVIASINKIYIGQLF